MSEVITMGEPIVTFASKEPNVSLVDAKEFHKIMGGAELNVAIGLKRLGHSVNYISQVGADPFGKYVIKKINSYGVGSQYVRQDPKGFTGHQLKQRVTKGHPDTYNYRKGSAACHLSSNYVNQINLDGVRFAHMSGIFPAISNTALHSFITLFHRLHENHISTTFDPNLRPYLWKSPEYMAKVINKLAGMANIVLPGASEAKMLIGTKDPEKIADYYLRGKYTHAVIVKLGPTGAYAKTSAGTSFTVKSFHVSHVVDTVGAGDGFALGIISALLEGKSLHDAVVRGNAIGALQVQAPGDNDGYPTREGLQKFYKKYNQKFVVHA